MCSNDALAMCAADEQCRPSQFMGLARALLVALRQVLPCRTLHDHGSCLTHGSRYLMTSGKRVTILPNVLLRS
jgi:hypothetical protein